MMNNIFGMAVLQYAQFDDGLLGTINQWSVNFDVVHILLFFKGLEKEKVRLRNSFPLFLQVRI